MLQKYYLAVNIAAFLAYTADKIQAIRDGWRISERTLLLLAAIGGGGGAFLAMQVMRHKTRHLDFMVLVPAFCVLHILLWVFLWRR